MFDPDSGTFRSFPLYSSQELENINALCPDGRRIWVGTYSKGAGLLDIESGHWSPLKVEDRNMSYSCYAICKDHEGRIWMGATETLALYDPHDNIFRPVKKLNGWITSIKEDRSGRLWIATPGGGLHRFSPTDGQWRHYSASNEAGALPNNHVQSLYIDPDGELFISTPEGVCTYQAKTDTFLPFDMGIDNLSVQSVCRTGDEFWISTSKGLINLKDGASRIYGMADGLSDSQFVPGAVLVASDGKIYYGTVNGLSRVDPRQMLRKGNPPVLKFTGLDILNNPVAVGNGPLTTSLNDIGTLDLSHAENTFSIFLRA